MLRSRLLFVCLAAVLAAAVATSRVDGQSQTSGVPFPSSRHIGYLPMRGMHPTTTTAASNPNNIPYNGGTVLPVTTTYAIFWGPPSDFPGDAVAGLEDFLEGLNGTPYLSIANQYLLGQTAQTHFGGNLFDHSTPPTQDPPTSEIVTEVYNVLSDNGQKPDPTALYMVFTSNFPNENYYCAFHDYGTGPGGTTIHILYIPNSNNQPLRWVQPPELSCNQHSNGLQAGANSMAHELMESITDPNFDAWANYTTGDEIGDPCNFTYQRCVTLANETTWQLQEIWSNKVTACVQGAGGSE